MPTARPRAARPELSWSGWGDPALATPLPDGLSALLRQALGITGGRGAPASIEDLELEPVRLVPRAAAELEAVVGKVNARGDHEARARHALGKSTLDLLRLRANGPIAAPDLVLMPADHDEVLALLRICARHGVAVTPFGGGTSVVGGLAPEAAQFAGAVAIDVRRMNALVALDEVSRLAVLEPGLRGPEAEQLLGGRGYTIGHFPQSYEYATLGGFAATRSSGQASAGYGRFDELVLALRVATPAGTFTLGRAPRSAAGPDLRQLVLGSEGSLGVITQVTVAVRPTPGRRLYQGWRLPSFAAGADALRRLVQDGPTPTVMRLSDEAETAIGLAQPAELDTPAEAAEAAGGCLAIVGFEGTEDEVAARQLATAASLTAAGATPVPGAGDGWARDRYRGPYLRDALLDSGALVETLETVCFWSVLPSLYAAVTGAVRETLTGLGSPPVILAHISHVYPAGASLYFTVACNQLEDPIEQWRAAKAAAGEAILATGGSITHHHGVGRDHRAWYEREVGSLSIALLGEVKRTLDPAGILNPGVLIPRLPPRTGSE